MKGYIMGNSGLNAVTGLLAAFGFIIVVLLVFAFLIIQYWNLLRDFRTTPPYILPPHVLRRSAVLVLTELAVWSLTNLFPASNRDHWTVTSFLTAFLGSAVFLGLLQVGAIWWEMRRKTVRNRQN